MSIRNGVKQPQDFRPWPDDPMRPRWQVGRRARKFQQRDATPARAASVAGVHSTGDNHQQAAVAELWRPEYAHWAHHMALLGATDGEIAQAIGVSYQTFVRWKDEKWALADALARAARATAAVAASLYMRAVGFTHPVEKLLVVKGEVHRVEQNEYVPPSVEAARYWLENKQPERWRSRQEVTGAGGAPLIPPGGDVNVAVGVLTSGKADANEMAKAYLRVMGTPLPEAALPPPAQESSDERT